MWLGLPAGGVGLRGQRGDALTLALTACLVTCGLTRWTSRAWALALWMMALATAGGWAGARLAKRLPLRWVRWLIIGTGLVMSVVFFARAGLACAALP